MIQIISRGEANVMSLELDIWDLAARANDILLNNPLTEKLLL